MSEETALRSIETKFYIHTLDFRRGTEEERTRLGGLLSARLFYGPLTIEKIEPIDGRTRVWFLLRLKIEGDFLNINGEFAGYELFQGDYEDAKVNTDEFKQAMAEHISPYLQEVLAYITGRAGISPLIVPLPNRNLMRVQKEQT